MTGQTKSLKLSLTAQNSVYVMGPYSPVHGLQLSSIIFSAVFLAPCEVKSLGYQEGKWKQFHSGRMFPNHVQYARGMSDWVA